MMFSIKVFAKQDGCPAGHLVGKQIYGYTSGLQIFWDNDQAGIARRDEHNTEIYI